MSVEICANCGATTKPNGSLLFSCPCKTVKYCSKECQTADWPTHKGPHKDAMAAISALSAASSSSSSLASASSAFSASSRKVDVILLAEQHGSEKCIIKNGIIIAKMLQTIPNIKKRDILFVSEGRDINDCYTVLQIDTRLPGNIIQEEDPTKQTTEEMLSKLILTTQIIEYIAIRAGINYSPSGIPLNKEFVLQKTNIGGFRDLLDKCGAYTVYQKALDSAEAKNLTEYSLLITQVYQMIRDTGLNDLPSDQKSSLQDMLNDIIKNSGNYKSTKPIREYISNLRDINIIKRVEEYIRKNPHITTVVIIFGVLHYASLKALIEASPILQLDSRSNATYGGKRTVKKRKTLKKYKKNNKKTYRRRN
jgi:hypothetical protein